MARRKKYPKLPNGYGSIKRLSGKNRTNPYGVYPPVKEFDSRGIPVPQKALCYVDDWYKGFTVLTWYKNGEYYEGREKELSSDYDELNKQVVQTLRRFNQTQREACERKTFSDIFKEYYLWKFKKHYDHKDKKTAMEQSMRAAYKNCKALHNESFGLLTTNNLQEIVDNCPRKHASLELIVTLYHQMYAYAVANDIVDKDYSKFVKINQNDDDEHGVPFTDSDIKTLWDNQTDDIVQMILIMCYSGFRISAYLDMKTDVKKGFFQGGVKTQAGKDRIVPIHSSIMPLVKKRLKTHGCYLPEGVGGFRDSMYDKLKILGIEKHTPHDCRHTFSMLCDKYEVNENDKKTMLGHKFNDVTNNVYRHRDLEELRKQIEKIIVCH
ncbi:tyrosine-type recombinase/integrase [Faecalicatena contorta]|uniref:tyrosine-type recombinase/integrase n=1 Tax=Faecalicatena contorta TaxID=39482 RepID=UPI001F169A56|nr:integrase [Faecalicatena contorta]MCF2555581.1 integrase [Faecalicatena contorta]